MSRHIDASACVEERTVFDGAASVGFCSRVGHADDEPVRLGDGVRIGSFCLIEGGAQLGPNVEVDHYCRIGWNTRIGAGSRVLYGAQVFDEAKIGKNCIIAGELVDRTVVGDWVRFQGETAHSHRDATSDWDETVEESPVIESCSVVGVGAIIIGGVRIGPRSFVGAGERVRCDVPPEHVVLNGKLIELSGFRGMIKLREL